MSGKVGSQALEKNSNWKGGRSIASNGYVLVKLPGHHLADVRGYVYEHRLVAEEMLGRRLRPGEEVHHREIDGVVDKTDNRPERLLVCASSLQHGEQHRRMNLDRRRHGEDNPTIRCACGCGAEFPKFDRSGRPRRYVSSDHVAVRDADGRFARQRRG